MNHYMIELQLPEILDKSFLEKVPEQRDHVSTLMHQGKLLVYCMSENQRNIWACIQAESIKNVRDLVNEFPLVDYFQVNIVPLEFLNQANHGLHMLSLN